MREIKAIFPDKELRRLPLDQVFEPAHDIVRIPTQEIEAGLAQTALAITGFAGHTGDGTVGDTLRQASLAAAIGSGVIWTFGDSGIVVPPGTANGIGIICPTGTGQILDYYFDWDE